MKWLFRVALTLTTLVILAVLALFLVPADRVANLAAERFEELTGRTLVIEGPVRATLWPRLGVRAEGVTVANAPWSDAGPMLQAQAMDIGVSAMSLFSGTIQVEVLEIEGARLLLERRMDGTANWEIAATTGGTPAPAPAAAAPGTPAAPSRKVAIDRAILTGAEITYLDQSTDTSAQIRAVDLSASVPDIAGPVEISGSALFNGVAVSGQARIGALQALIDGALVPVGLSLTSGATDLALEGRADIDPLSFDGTIRASSGDRFALLRAIGMTVPDLPAGLGERTVAIASNLTLAPAGSVHLRGMTLTLDGNTVTGDADLLPGDARPRITANLAAPALDLTALSQKGQGGETALVTETGWGREAIDVSGLFAADARITLVSGPITLGDATLDSLSLAATLSEGRAVVTLQPLVAYGGTVTGDIVVNGRGGLSTRATLDLAGLQMQPFLAEFADYDRLVGEANVTLDLLGVGSTTQALVESLDGTLSFDIGKGEILGLDIAGMIRTLDTSFRGDGQKTVFDRVAASWTVADGVARGDDLALDAPLLVATGAGTVDLGAQTLEYRLLSTLRRNADSDGITIPVLISGPWASPRIRPDLEYLARQRLDVEREELEARARAEADEARARAGEAARTRVAEELDIAPEVLTDGDALQGAIKDRVEQQLLDLLLNR
ncbi:MAG: AsmA family protein [Jannaschia sp.]